MIEYANESTVKFLKQYDMLSKSLNFTTDSDQRQEISYQMTRIIQNILDSTNTIYEKKYKKIVNRSTFLMNEEKNRLLELINLINERKTFINNQISNNQELTGITFDYPKVLGEDELDNYKNQVRNIEKYKNNIRMNSILKDELEELEKNIKKANEKIKNNVYLNKQLEDRMIRLLDKSLNKLGLYELQERSKEIDLAYTELGYSLEKAKENAKIARRECTSEIILECDNMLSSITLEYERYKEKKLILRLIEIYRNKVNNYEELLAKREEINNILAGIVSSELYLEVGSELNKEYATIKLEKQDLTTLRSLLVEKENKERTLKQITKENESQELRGMLATLLENEKKYQEKLKLEKKRKEEEARRRRLEEEKRKQIEMIKRQKVLEEERKKEIEERTKQLLAQKKNPTIFGSNQTNKTEPNKDNKPKNKTNKTNWATTTTSPITFEPKKEVLTKKTSHPNSKNNVQSEIRRVPKREVNYRPSDDIFSREIKTSEKTNEGIPLIKNNNTTRKKEVSQTAKHIDDVFPKLELNKEKDIFPKLEPQNNDSFFDDDEFKDLNKYMENDKKNNWF